LEQALQSAPVDDYSIRGEVAALRALLANLQNKAQTAIELAGQRCLSYGIGSVMDACVGMIGGWSDVAAYEAAERAGRLPVRMTMAMGGGPAGIAEEAFAKGYLTGKGSGMLRVGPVKFFTDGSAGGCTAAMSKPYTNGDLGVLIFSDRELDEMVGHYHRRGFQVAVHAIGDAAIDRFTRPRSRICCANGPPRIERPRLRRRSGGSCSSTQRIDGACVGRRGPPRRTKTLAPSGTRRCGGSTRASRSRT
jgi:hypothetical protein